MKQTDRLPEQTIRFCTTDDGVQIAHAVSGSGPPLVRVASWLSHLEYDWDSPIWSHWFRELSKGHRLIRYDARGTGLSDRTVADISLEGWLLDLEAVVEALELEQFNLLGLCQGGPVALAYAAQHPENVNRLILYDSYLYGGLAKDSPVQVKRQAKLLAELIEVGWGQPTQAFHKTFTELLFPRADPQKSAWLVELQRKTVEPAVAAGLWRRFHELDVRPFVAEVKAESLVLHVRGDQMVPFEQGRQLAAKLGNSQFVPLAGSNHILLEQDRDWPRLLNEVRRFLGTSASPSTGVAEPAFAGRLTPRQLEVLNLLAQGLDNDTIAAELSISSKTVRNHVSRIYRRMGVDSRAEAIVRARQAGMGG